MHFSTHRNLIDVSKIAKVMKFEVTKNLEQKLF